MPVVAETGAADPGDMSSQSERRAGHGNGQGWFAGPAYLAAEPMPDRATGSPLDAADLLEAIALAAGEIETSMAAADPLGAGMLEFQAAMLRDPELVRPALRSIASGKGVVLAWAACMDEYVAAFHDAGDGRGVRNMDIVDIRNRVLAKLCGAPRAGFPPGSVFVGDDMEPSLFLEHDWSKGGAIALSAGSLGGHVAMLARSRAVPMVCGIGDVGIEPGQLLLVDAAEGHVVTRPSDSDLRFASRNPRQLRVTRPGAGFSLYANINQLGDLELFDPAACAGVGLVRTEFLFGGLGPLADEAMQFDAYQRIAAHFRGPSCIRLFDLGGDKRLPGASGAGGSQVPGQRGVRLLLAQPQLLRPQARALLRAAAASGIGVTIPMVTIPDEVEAIRDIFAEESANLARAGIPHAMPAIGMMVEVPAAALMLDGFTNADFFSIGTNDLLQFLTAVPRDDETMRDVRQKALPALGALIASCVAVAARMQKPLSVCGDLAGDPAGLAMLTGAGVRRFSTGAAQFSPTAALLAGSVRP